jgi:hypothetical protein
LLDRARSEPLGLGLENALTDEVEQLPEVVEVVGGADKLVCIDGRGRGFSTEVSTDQTKPVVTSSRIVVVANPGWPW